MVACVRCCTLSFAPESRKLTFALNNAGTDVRNGNPLRTKAKTVLIRLAHSLQYQLRAAQGKTSGFNFVDEEKDAKEKTEGKVARKKAKTATATTATTTTTNGEAQTTLNFGQGGAMVLQK